MIAAGQPGGDGQTAPQAPPSPPLGQLKEALRVLEHTQNLFNNMKAKVVYACGEGHLLASDEGRQYLARVIKSLDDEHRMIRSGWPRLTAALEVARTVNKVATARGGVQAALGGRSASSASLAAAAAAAASEPPSAGALLQGHCRSVLQQLEGALCEELLARGGTQLVRPAKRLRTVEPEPQPSTAAATSPPASSPTAAVSTPVPGLPYSAPVPTGAPSTSAASSRAGGGPLELLGVLLRVRALDGFTAGSQAAAAAASAPVGSLASMRLHALDDGANALSLPSALTAALANASAASTAAAAGGGAGGAAGGGPGIGVGVLSQVEPSLLAAGAARLAAATQVRMLLPGVFVVNVLLEGPGSASPLRVAVDSADRAFELDPWATPTTQVFRRLSALATRVLTYFLKRAPLTVTPRPPPGPATPASPPQSQPGSTSPGSGASAPTITEPGSPGAAALEDLLLWLLTGRDLFSKRCSATGRLMAWDPSVQYPVPPIFRAFKLPREELRLRVLDPSRVAAYHLHVAPVEQLGWAEDVPGEAVAALGGDAAVPQRAVSVL